MFQVQTNGPGRLVVALALALVFPAHGSTASTQHHEDDSDTQVTCDGAIQHPLDVRITPLDPIAPGAGVRMRVRVTGRAAFERGSVQLVATGAARLAGAARAALPARAAGVPADAEFAVGIPAGTDHALLQFRVTAEGRDGIAARGATYLLLPNGPTNPGRSITAADGRRLIDFGARRIGR